MTTLFREDDDQPSSSELTLGIGSLLSIFFGVVLVCGIFFGFGYSMGRRNVQSAPAARTASPVHVPEVAADTAETTPPPSRPEASTSTSAPKIVSEDGVNSPSRNTRQPSPTVAEAAPETSSDKQSRPAPPASTPTLAAVPAAHRPPTPAKPHAGIAAVPAAAPVEETPTAGHPLMVQIAAVSRQEDAEVLAGALRKRGFVPQVHSGTTDKFFHVQVGPFDDKEKAEAMKQHLLADGYNAIVK